MKILLVDDNPARANKLIDDLTQSANIASESITHVSDVRLAKRLLRCEYFDVMIMDVVLPLRIEDGRPSSQNGLALLDEVARSSFLKKPERIIGITAYIDDLGSFRSKFAEHCSVVVEADVTCESWRAQIINALRYSVGSMMSRQVVASGVAVFLVHGIRTYGYWQERFKRLVHEHCEAVEFFSYKYGYFSSLSFIFKSSRNNQVDLMCQRIESLASDVGGKKIIIFSHSFGTFLVAESIKRLAGKISGHEITVVMAGSVLPDDYNWNFLPKGIRLINDCGSGDVVLYLPRAFVAGLGMAGKIGFNGFNSLRFVNRFHSGGHSHYFEGDDFMMKYWVPIVANSLDGQHVDCRGEPGIWPFMDGAVAFFGKWRAILAAIAAVGVATTVWALF